MDQNTADLIGRLAVCEKDVAAFHRRVDDFKGPISDSIKEIEKDIKTLATIPIIVENLKAQVSSLAKQVESLSESQTKINEKLAHDKGKAAGIMLALAIAGGFLGDAIKGLFIKTP